MPTLRLRTKLQLWLLLISAALTCATLLIVHHTVRNEVRREILDDLHSSVVTFQKVLHDREMTLARSAALVSNLPSLKALMTTHDAATIQEASRGVWQLTASDLLMLTDRSGRVVALHTSTPGFSREMAEAELRGHTLQDEVGTWWFGAGHLYEVFLQPVYFGSASEDRLLGVLAVGYEVDERLAREASRIAGGDVSIRYGNSAVVSTLRQSQERELAEGRWGTLVPSEIVLGGERFLTATVDLDVTHQSPARLIVLKSYDQATGFLDRLNRLVLALGLAAVVCGSILVYFISRKITRPLESLASGVKALQEGDFAFPLSTSGRDEVAVVTKAFADMRASMQNTQRRLLESERLATIGLMASSISHDLRHPLTAILANAEFLSEARLNGAAREDLYQEIRSAVSGMTELIDSLLEFSRGKESLQLTRGKIRETILAAVQSLRQRPEFQHVQIDVSGDCSESWLDHKRLERVWYNLLLNACQAAPRDSKIRVSIEEQEGAASIRVADNGPGIAAAVRERLFQPFVSYGKENGTGLGLTIAQKIVENHGGSIRVAETSSGGTTFELRIPLDGGLAVSSVVQATVIADSPLVRPRS